MNVINARFSEFVEFCNDTINNNHVEGSEVNEAAHKILNEREAVGAEYADVFIQWLLYEGGLRLNAVCFSLDDIGHVCYVSHMGTDLTVVNSARVSFDKESHWK